MYDLYFCKGEKGQKGFETIDCETCTKQMQV